jgi:hypothetical protein
MKDRESFGLQTEALIHAWHAYIRTFISVSVFSFSCFAAPDPVVSQAGCRDS